MDEKLRHQFFSAMALFKRVESAFSTECELPLNELAILQTITGKCAHSECASVNLNLPDIQDTLQISKPAISYILNSLEKKSYITREIYSNDKRKNAISATSAGIAASEHSVRKCNDMWKWLLTEFGESDMQQFVELIGRLTELVEKK